MSGAEFALIGAIGLVRLKIFYDRVHAPTLGATAGTALILLGSMLCFSVLQTRFVAHEILIATFVLLPTPVTFILLVRAPLYRDRAKSDPNVPQMDWTHASSMKVRFCQPEVLVDLTGDFSEKIGSVLIASLVCGIDGVASEFAKPRKSVSHRDDMFALGRNLARICLQLGAEGDGLRRPIGEPAQRYGPFGDIVNKAADARLDLIEQFVQGDEVGAFDVPVRLFEAQAQIDCVH
jgi:multicomponent K+:H+ antiporter subunit G